MVQSVELLLDEESEAAIRAQWDLLGDAGLPTARRSQPSPHHTPHITLWAGQALSSDAEASLPDLFRDLDLDLLIGNVLLFGPRRGHYVLVRQVMISAALAALQRAVAGLCRGSEFGGFDDGAWSPHVTLARRLAVDQVTPALRALVRAPGELTVTVREARRWDSDRRTAWSVST